MIPEEFYDKMWCEVWNDMERYNPTAQHLKLIIAKEIKRYLPFRSFLDAGCGAGFNIEPIAEQFPKIQIVGTDLTEKICQIAAKNLEKYTQVTICKLNLEKDSLNQTFDFILCNQVLEHIDNDLLALKNLGQMANKYILMTVPSGRQNSTSLLNGHIRHYSELDLQNKIQAAGLSIRKMYSWGFPFHNLYKNILDALPVSYQTKIGMGSYGFWKKFLSKSIFWLFYLNIFKKGDNIICLCEKK